MNSEVFLSWWMIPSFLTVLAFARAYQLYRRECPSGVRNQWDSLVAVAMFCTAAFISLAVWVIALVIRLNSV